MNLDPYTFGSRPAAVKLAEVLNEVGSKGITSRVSHFLSCNSRIVKSLNFIPTYRERMALANLVYRHVHTFRIDTDKYPVIIETLTKNIAIGKVKQILREQEPDGPENISYASYSETPLTGSELEFGDDLTGTP